MTEDRASHLGANVRRLREARGVSQQQMASLAGIPRPTWASLESGAANPTLSVLTRVAASLQVSIEELVDPPRTACRLLPAHEAPVRRRQGATLRPLFVARRRGRTPGALARQPAPTAPLVLSIPAFQTIPPFHSRCHTPDCR